MSDYAKSVDEFAPGIHVAKREFPSLAESSFGGITADMVGLGSKNLRATAEALRDSKNLQEVLEKTRLNEQKVTKEFKEKQAAFDTILKDTLGKDRIQSICSGDDCVAIPAFSLGIQHKQSLLDNLASRGYSSDFRISFVSPRLKDPEVRNIMGTQGESIEKILRKSLASQMDPKLLKGLTFGIDMQAHQLNRGGVQLILGQSKELNLKISEQQRIHNAFKEAVKVFNESQKQQNNIDSFYSPL